MSTQRQISFLVDQFGLPLEPGSFYGVATVDAPPTRAAIYKCVMVIRGKAWLRPIDSKLGPARVVCNIEANGYRFYLLDANLSQLQEIPPGAIAANVAVMRKFLHERAKSCKKIQTRQAALIHEIFEALEGSRPDSDLNDAICSFVRDPESHETTETLLAAYEASLRGAE